MSRPKILSAVRQRVAEASRFRCGYCLTSQDIVGPVLELDHILPVSKGGADEEDNLWLACSWCNAYKGKQTDALDPLTGDRVSLFDPRRRIWADHFKWSDDGTLIVGLTACGRATVDALQLNNEYVVPARRRWVAVGWHPPSD
ncbi:MAG: HNH endonuclease [Chloroflexi bacterium]|nr:HNH endonuclease [Chloroflexota bacterium]MBI3761161.1 HNH endonuclease [Chloroflexota bacterium]